MQDRVPRFARQRFPAVACTWLANAIIRRSWLQKFEIEYAQKITVLSLKVESLKNFDLQDEKVAELEVKSAKLNFANWFFGGGAFCIQSSKITECLRNDATVKAWLETDCKDYLNFFLRHTIPADYRCGKMTFGPRVLITIRINYRKTVLAPSRLVTRDVILGQELSVILTRWNRLRTVLIWLLRDWRRWKEQKHVLQCKWLKQNAYVLWRREICVN